MLTGSSVLLPLRLAEQGDNRRAYLLWDTVGCLAHWPDVAISK